MSRPICLTCDGTSRVCDYHGVGRCECAGTDCPDCWSFGGQEGVPTVRRMPSARDLAYDDAAPTARFPKARVAS